MIEQKERVARFIGNVKQHLEHLDDLQPFRGLESPNNVQELSQHMHAYKTALNQFTNIMERVLTVPQGLLFTTEEAYLAGDEAIQALTQIYESMVPLLNDKLVGLSEYYE